MINILRDRLSFACRYILIIRIENLAILHIVDLYLELGGFLRGIIREDNGRRARFAVSIYGDILYGIAFEGIGLPILFESGGSLNTILLAFHSGKFCTA